MAGPPVTVVIVDAVGPFDVPYNVDGAGPPCVEIKFGWLVTVVVVVTPLLLLLVLVLVVSVDGAS